MLGRGFDARRSGAASRRARRCGRRARRAAPAPAADASSGYSSTSLQDEVASTRCGWRGSSSCVFPLVECQAQRLAPTSRSCASSPCGKTRTSTGSDRNGPETSTSDSHSAWWRAIDMVIAARRLRHEVGHRHREEARRRIGVARADQLLLALDLVAGARPGDARARRGRARTARFSGVVKSSSCGSVSASFAANAGLQLAEIDCASRSTSRSARSSSRLCSVSVRSRIRASSARSRLSRWSGQSAARRSAGACGADARGSQRQAAARVRPRWSMRVKRPSRSSPPGDDDLLVQPLVVAAEHDEPARARSPRGRSDGVVGHDARGDAVAACAARPAPRPRRAAAAGTSAPAGGSGARARRRRAPARARGRRRSGGSAACADARALRRAGATIRPS